MNKEDVLRHILSNARIKGIWIDHVNAHRDHMHCLISLNPDQCLSKVVQLIKGESSFWINRNIQTMQGFQWADEYYAASVSARNLEDARQYILHQEVLNFETLVLPFLL